MTFDTFQDLDTSSDEEDNFQSNRKQFQQARSVSTASKKSISFFDMELTNKDDNIRNSVPFVRQITEDGKAKLEIYRPTTNPIYIYTQVSPIRQYLFDNNRQSTWCYHITLQRVRDPGTSKLTLKAVNLLCDVATGDRCFD